jgi:hypothetical protein
MSELTREELDAKLDARDARADTRLGIFEGRIEQAINEMRRDSQRYDQDVRELKIEISSSKKSSVGLAIGSTLTILFGMAGINLAMFSVFDSGRETAVLTESAAQSVKNASELLGKVQASLDEQAKRAKEQQLQDTPTDQPVIQK